MLPVMNVTAKELMERRAIAFSRLGRPVRSSYWLHIRMWVHSIFDMFKWELSVRVLNLQKLDNFR